MDKSWGNGVDGDVVFSPLDGQALGEMSDSRLRHAVNRFGRERRESGLRTHVDDAPTLLADHDAARSLGGKECTFQVNCHREVEVVFSIVFGEIAGSDPGIVDEDVEAAEVLDG